MQRLQLAILASLVCLGAIVCAAAHNRRATSADEASARIARIENAFAPISLGEREPPVKLNLQQLMEISNVSQLRVAVIEDYKIDWAKGYGVRESGDPVTE